MFYGEKLTNLRQLNGLSRKELADKLDVTEQSIWQYENDSITPRIELLNKIGELFAVKSNYFFASEYLENMVSEERVAYRTKDRESRKKTKLELVFLNYVDYFINAFERNLIRSKNEILKIKLDLIELIDNPNLSREEIIQKSANIARKELRLKDNKDLMFVLENSGIYILEKNLGTQIDAYSTVTKDNRFYIILGTKKKTAVRRNFDLAHELGHLLLHAKIDMDVLNPSELKIIEKEADHFASKFLLPEQEFLVDFEKLTRKSNPDYYIELKRKYLVSIAALEMRAYGLGVMSYQENRYFWGQLTKKGYKEFEPLDDEIPPIRPGKIRFLVKLLLDKKIINLNEFLDDFDILPSFLIRLFNFDKEFLDDYLNVQKDYFSDLNIININDFRKS